MTRKTIKTGHCLNCGHPLQGENFCPECGQENNARKLSVKHLISETFSNLFAFDGRFFQTLFKLFRYPGQVPREYIDGKRARYMHPIRIYFLSSLLLLTIIQFSQESSEMVNINFNENASDSLASADSTDTASAGNDEAARGNIISKVLLMKDFYSNHKSLKIEEALDSLDLQDNFYNRFLYAQSAKISETSQDDFNKYLFSKLFWVLFLFLPILALLLKLLYIRRPFYYSEHLFFTFYTQSVYFILLALILPWPGGNAFIVIVTPAFAAYLFIAMKNFYNQKTGKTALKFILLNMAVVPSFVLFFVLATLVAFIML